MAVMTPFIEWAGSVYAKVSASNVYGSSATSDGGNGATLSTYPDPPTLMIENEDARTATDLGISWTAGFDGGTDVIDYEV
jgi:hypothetical protein